MCVCVCVCVCFVVSVVLGSMFYPFVREKGFQKRPINMVHFFVLALEGEFCWSVCVPKFVRVQ